VGVGGAHVFTTHKQHKEWFANAWLGCNFFWPGAKLQKQMKLKKLGESEGGPWGTSKNGTKIKRVEGFNKKAKLSQKSSGTRGGKKSGVLRPLDIPGR